MEFTGERVIPNQVTEDLFNEHISRYVFASKFIKETDYVIDVGCGAGYGTYELSKVAANIVGIDISQEAIDYANENYGKENITFMCEDSRKIDLNKKANVAVSFEVVEHIERVEDYFEAIKNSLKPDGMFIVSTPNKKMYSDAIENYENPYHVKEYYYNEFQELLRRYFKYVTVFSQDFSQGLLFRNSEEFEGIVNTDYSEKNYDIESASFFIAVCSNVLFDTSNKSLLYTFSENNILAEKDRYISALKHEIEIRDQSVLTLQTKLHEMLQNNEELYSSYQKAVNETIKRDESVLATQKKLDEFIGNNEELYSLYKIAVSETLKRDDSIVLLKKENEELLNWARLANEETLKRDESIKSLQSAIEDLKR